jgi:hypothetical protein
MNTTSTLKQKRRRTKIVFLLALIFSLVALQSAGQQEIVYSANFQQFQTPSAQCTAWEDFRAQLTPDKSYQSVLFKGSRNETGLLLEDPDAVSTIAAAIHNNTFFSLNSSGQSWQGLFSVGLYLEANSVTTASAGSCTNNSTNFNLRPCITNSNWGGINGPSCQAESQRIDLIFYYGGISLVENNPATCPESSDGSLLAEINDDNPPFTFEWSNGVSTSGASVTSQIDDLIPGEYTLTVTNNEGAEFTETFTVGPHPFSVEFDMTPSSNCGAALDGSVLANIDGGTPPYTYSWETGDSDDEINGLPQGSYTLEVTDANDCLFSAVANVLPEDETAPIVSTQNIVVYLDEEGTANVEAQSIDNNSTDNCSEYPSRTMSKRLVIPIASSMDDIEETRANGEIYEDSSDLEFFADFEANDGEQVIGLRFQNVQIPKDVPITNAYIQFHAEEETFDNQAPQAIIKLQNTANAEAFELVDYNLSSRQFLEDSVVWDMPVWTETAQEGPDQRTPNLASMLSKINRLSEWNSGNSIVIQMYAHGYAGTDLGNTAATYDESPPNAPKLIIEFGDNEREFTCAELGQNTVSLFVMDDAYNVASAEAIITVMDTVSPVIEAADATIYLDENGQGLNDNNNLISHAADNCEGSMMPGISEEVYYVNSGADDAEESLDGWMSISSGDLELFYESSDDRDQYVGLKFRNIEIPEGVLVTNAYIQFTAEKESNDMTSMGHIFGELAPNPADFSSTDFDISTRSKTNNSIDWTIPVWNSYGAGPDQATPDISTILNEIISQENWTSGNDVVFIFEPDSEELDSDHEAISTDDESESVSLHFEYIIPDYASFDCNNLGPNPVLLSRTDLNGNTTEVEAIVNVIDTVSPSVELQNIEVVTNAEGSTSISVEDIEVASSDNCNIVSKELNVDQFTCEDYGSPVEVELTVTDNSGNQTTETALVTLIDQTAPVADPNDIAVQLNADGSFTLTDQMVTDLISNDLDDCSGVNPNSIVISQMEFSCEDLGVNQLSYALLDNADNLGGAQFTVTVEDNQAPLAIAQDITVQLDENGFASISGMDADNGSEDNCTITSRDLSVSEFTCDDLGSVEITMTVADASGNEDTDTFTATVEDNVGPSIDEVIAVTLYLDENGEGIIDSSPILVQASDACGLGSVFIDGQGEDEDLELDGLPFNCELAGEGENFPAYVTDINGNQTEFWLNLNIVDTISPAFSLTQIELELEPSGSASLTEGMLIDYATDNCEVGEILIQDGFMDCSQIGEFTTLVTVSDIHGNSIQRSLDVTLVDNLAPIALAQDLNVQLDENGLATITGLDADNGSEDNCSIALRDLSVSEFTCDDIGQVEVTLTVVDESGNQDETTFIATVEDNVGPSMDEEVSMTIYLDENGESIIDTAPLLAQAADACGVQKIVVETDENEFLDINGSSLTCEDVGIEDGQLWVEDVNGNMTPFWLNLNVLDTISPAFTLTEIELALDELGNAELTEDMLMSYAYDNCGIAEIAIQEDFFDCSQLGEFSTEIIVFDMNGNATQRTLQITLADEQAPTVDVQALSLQLDAEGLASLNVDELDMFTTENCGIVSYTFSQPEFNCDNLGTQLVSLTVEDAAGNTAMAEFEVTVVDTEAPTITGPANIEICEGESYGLKLEVGDNCSFELEQVQGPEDSSPEAGEYIVEMMATDPAGNSSSFTASLTVHPSPDVDLGEDQEVLEGDLVTLVAGEDNDLQYLWSDGSTQATLQFQAEETVTVSVIVTNDAGCEDEDFITITIVDPLGVEDEHGNSASLFPNPTAGELNITLDLLKNTDKLQLSIMDLSGKVVIQKQITVVENGQIVSVNMAQLANGVYLINLRDKNVNLTQRVVKQ